MVPIGYLTPPPPTQSFTTRKPEDYLTCFDSGMGITVQDAKHHVLVMGTTGSGKTASVVLPAVQSLIERGHCGLVVDIKGNMRRQVYALARNCGREDDVVELGSAPSAKPVNFLQGMKPNHVHEFLKALTVNLFAGQSHNLDFHMKGVSMARDCALLLQYLNAFHPAFEQNLATLAEMFANPLWASELYAFFKEHVYESKDEDQEILVQTITANPFHILLEKEKGPKSSQNRAEQLAYATQSIRDALKNFTDTPGISEKFAACNGTGLEMQTMLNDNKIVLLRFGPDTGPIGAMLARCVMQEYYKAVYATGMDLPKGRCSFACLDEFQEVADISPGRFSDVNFVAMAREFNAVFIASTQSMAALMNQGHSAAAVDAFVSNFNNRVLFYSDDPLSQAMASRYDPGKRLSELDPGQAFVVRYDQETRRHAFGLETFQNAFEKTKLSLGKGERGIKPAEHREAAPARLSLKALVALTSQHKRSQKVQARASVTGSDTQSAWMEGLLSELPKKADVTMHTAEAASLINKYSQFFSYAETADIAIPAGWVAHTERAFAAFLKSGLQIHIAYIGACGGALHVHESTPGKNAACDYTGQHLLNSLLRVTRQICAFCGGETPPVERERSTHSDDGCLPVCESCLKAFGLLCSQSPQSIA